MVCSIKVRPSRGLAVALLLAPVSPAAAVEIVGGIFAHDISTPLDKSGQEDGMDLHLGWRGNPMRALKVIGSPAPHVYVIANTAGNTNFAVAGIDWKIGGKVYVRPGIGLAVHDGPRRGHASPDRIDFGSRVLFAPELGLGMQTGKRSSLELSWVHFSHAQLFGRQNPGSDSFGVRLNFRY
jgi:hypothetical protein